MTDNLPRPGLAGPPAGPGEPWLAPLAGYTDLPFRLLCREYGCSAASTEMVSAQGLLHDSESTLRLLTSCPEDNPLVVQLFGSDPDVLAGAVRLIREWGGRFFDLNAGCSVKKVVRSGSGAALLRDRDRLREAVHAMAEAAGEGAVGVKLRSGWSVDAAVAPDVARDLERAGAAWIALHPRFAQEGFSGTARWEHLRLLRDAVDLPVIGSGDLFTAEDALRCLRMTGIHGVMFARGALQWPPVFRRFRRLQGEAASPQDRGGASELPRLVRRHVELCRRHDDSRRSLLKMRSAMTWYLRGFSAAKAWRRHVVACASWRDFERLAERLGRQLEGN